MGSVKHTTEKALQMLRSLPRVSLSNIRDNPGARKKTQRGRGQHGGDFHGNGEFIRSSKVNFSTSSKLIYLRSKELENSSSRL